MNNKHSLLLTAGLLAAGAAQAAITVTELSMNNSAGGDITVTDLALTAGNDSVLVLLPTGENPTDFSATVDGLTAAELSEANGAGQASSVFAYALGNVTAGATVDVFIDTDDDMNGGYSIVQLFGATQTFTLGSTYWQDTDIATSGGANTTQGSIQLTGVASGSAFISSIGSRNGGGDVTLTGFSSSNYYDAGAATAGWGYSTGVSGTLDASFSADFDVQNNREIAFAAVAIAPVPEPSTYALVSGFFALGLILVRRRLRTA